MSSEPTVVTELRGGVLVITLNRPDRLNALTEEMRDQLRSALHTARADRAVRAVVLTGAGRAFCSGAELGAPPADASGTAAAPPPGGRLPRYAWLQEFHDLPAPVIAAVNGPAAGAGMGLALACDVRVMAAGAYLFPAFAARALAADNGVSWTLTRMVGPARALRWLWDAERIGAEDAFRHGLADVVVDDGAALGHALELAERWAAGPTVTFGVIKEQVYRAMEASFADQLIFEEYTQARVRGTEDVREGIAAFREKRTPRFVGR